jgi:hypothetical protein
MPRKKQRRSSAFQIAYYHVEITDWDWDYSFSANAMKNEDLCYADYRHLQIRGRVLRPRKSKAETAELIFFPKPGLAELERQRDDPRPISVGTMNMEGTKATGMRLTGYISMPADALGPVLQMLIAGRYKYVLLDGEPMRYRKAFIRHYYFTGQYNDEDYPDD